MDPHEFINYLAESYHLKPSQAVLKAVDLLGVTKAGIYKWLQGTKKPHQGKLNHMQTIVERDVLEKYTSTLEQFLLNQTNKKDMNKKHTAKREVIEKLVKYNAEHPHPEFPGIKRVDWYVPGDERDIDNIKAIQKVSRMQGYEGHAYCIIVTVHGSLKRSDPAEDEQLNKVCENLKDLIAPLKMEDYEGIPAAPWKTKEFLIYLK